jgi:hypothetical protein
VCPKQVILVGVALMVLATACGGDDTAAPTASKTTPTTASTPASTTTTTQQTTTTPSTTTTTTIPSLTIMPIGDTATSGITNWATYRCFLDGMLNDAGVAFDFVGRLSAPHWGEPYG